MARLQLNRCLGQFLEGIISILFTRTSPRVTFDHFCGLPHLPLAALRAPVDDFFLKVTVNADDPELRLNRLRLLGELRAAVHTVADFSKIAG